MAYYLPMVQYINQDVVQNLNSMPVITLNGLKGQPLRWHSALGHRVPVSSTARCHPRRLSTVLRADLNRVDGFSPFSGISSGARSSASATPHPLQATVPTQTAHAYLRPVTSDLQSPSYAPDVWKENPPQLLETVDQSSIEGEQLKEWINTIKGLRPPSSAASSCSSEIVGKPACLVRVPMEILHNYPTTLVHSFEGLHKDVDWDKLLRLQCANGSFLCSPASTACALAYTKDEKCLDYLNKLLVNFDNAVPNVYPVDLFEHLWMVDRLERPGVSHYFKQEIKDALEYVYRYWTDFGIGWTGNLNVQDIDDTAMGFRLLRLHGFDVSEDCFREFYKDGEFFCMAGQTSQAVTGIFNFYRASQTLFPGETLLEKGRSFAKIFLENKHAKGECYDKWMLTKDLDGEVEHALNFPWYASVPRIEHRTYSDHYGTNDIWIGKCLYRMPYVNNKVFLDLAKADFNLCQSIHQKELEEVIRWNAKCNFQELKFARQKSVECYFSAAATMFEPEMAQARLVWARCSVLATVLDDYFDVAGTIEELRLFLEAVKRWDSTVVEGLSAKATVLFAGLYNTVNSISQEACLVQGRDVSHHLRYFWETFLTSTLTEREWIESNYVPTMQEYMKVAEPSTALEPILLSTLFFVPGELLSDEVIASYDYHHVMQLVNRAGRLLNDIRGLKVHYDIKS
ncbi:unnamed protein product [Sphagnum jensenii]|uniref:Uncharacterized protein n=1 Tax=Sphagnum jensenii TaxID=128206 RepID=A0ABP0WSG4_9BRYO